MATLTNSETGESSERDQLPELKKEKQNPFSYYLKQNKKI